MSRQRDKRSKATGKGGSYRPFLMVYHEIFDSVQYQSIPGNALRLLHDFAREWTGKNNGNISFANIAARCEKRGMKDNWANRGTRHAAVAYLTENEWLIRTKRGGLHMGCDLFALSWLPIDASDRHDYPGETVPSHAWKNHHPEIKKMAFSKSELTVLKTRTTDAKSGVQNDTVVLKTRTLRSKLRAA